MAVSNQRVMDMVRREINRNPGVSSEALFQKAKKLDRSIARLSTRQFHAKYPLQVKRAMKTGRKAAKVAAPVKRRRRRRVKSATAKSTTSAAPVKRRGPGRPRKSTTAAPAPRATAASGRGRDQVRAILMQFALDVTSAADKPREIVKVLSNVDGLVDRVMNATR